MEKQTLNICHLYPDVLNLYGDTGNITCIAQRLHWRGFDCHVEEKPIGEKLNAGHYDLFFIGGGQDFEQEVLLKDAKENKRAEILKAIDEEKVLLAICGGYQILGNYYRTWDGQEHEFMGCLDVYTQGQKERLIGNYMFTCEELGGKVVVGFENHSGKTYLNQGVTPIGKVLSGNGNNGEDGMEGARYKNVFATYSHGPLLPKNPEFCDLLIKKALKRKYGTDFLEELDDEREQKAHDYMYQRLSR